MLEDASVGSVGSAREEAGVYERIEDPLAPGIAVLLRNLARRGLLPEPQ